MEILYSPQAWWGAGLIFILRVLDMTLDTLRVLVVMRGKKWLAWILGAFQSGIYVIALSSVLSNLSNPLNMIGYALGFATGNVVGMFIEEKMAIGLVHIRIISPHLGNAVADKLRQEGFALTEIPGRGKDGMVTVLYCSVIRKGIQRVVNLIEEIDAEAFITIDDVRLARRGFWRA
ncbi:MAG: DUF2179 domain-containing protein [Anaerolineales bacterium]|nr:DUF2179 domain-containing protein [Anaerolineales bacterium]